MPGWVGRPISPSQKPGTKTKGLIHFGRQSYLLPWTKAVAGGIGVPVTAENTVPQLEIEYVIRTARLRLLPETKAVAHQLSGTAGACRFVWNHFLAKTTRDCQNWLDYRIGNKPSVSYYSLGTQFTKLRQQTLWLQEYHHATVKCTLYYLSEAYKSI